MKVWLTMGNGQAQLCSRPLAEETIFEGASSVCPTDEELSTYINDVRNVLKEAQESMNTRFVVSVLGTKR